MNPNPTRTLWISLGCAIFSMFLIYSYSQEKKAEYDKKFGTPGQVVVAAEDILEMSTIDDTKLSVEERPIEFVQPGAVKDPEDVLGFVAATPIKKGEQILFNKVLEPGKNTGLSNQVSPGKRAITIPIDGVRGVAKLLRPGDRVDIITAITRKTARDSITEVKTLLQDVSILATGVRITNNIPRKLEKGAGGQEQFRNLNGDTTFTNITVEVKPKEAQSLIYTMSSSPGSIFLTLRNPNDRATSRLANADVNTVLGRPKIKSITKPRKPAFAPKPKPKKRKRSGPFVEIK
jgi:pilus assembly protein CpaB